MIHMKISVQNEIKFITVYLFFIGTLTEKVKKADLHSLFFLDLHSFGAAQTVQAGGTASQAYS